MSVKNRPGLNESYEPRTLTNGLALDDDLLAGVAEAAEDAHRDEDAHQRDVEDQVAGLPQRSRARPTPKVVLSKVETR